MVDELLGDGGGRDRRSLTYKGDFGLLDFGGGRKGSCFLDGLSHEKIIGYQICRQYIKNLAQPSPKKINIKIAFLPTLLD